MGDYPLTAFLRGKAILIPLAVVQPHQVDGEGVRWVRVLGPDGDEMVEEVPLRFDANVIAEIEDRWGSATAWMLDAQRKTYKTLRDTIAIALGREERAVGVAMLETQLQRYETSVGAAFAIANGVDPTTAVTAVERVVAAARDNATRISQTSESPGTTGSEPGSDLSVPEASAETPPSSGD